MSGDEERPPRRVAGHPRLSAPAGPRHVRRPPGRRPHPSWDQVDTGVPTDRHVRLDPRPRARPGTAGEGAGPSGDPEDAATGAGTASATAAGSGGTGSGGTGSGGTGSGGTGSGGTGPGTGGSGPSAAETVRHTAVSRSAAAAGRSPLQPLSERPTEATGTPVVRPDGRSERHEAAEPDEPEDDRGDALTDLLSGSDLGVEEPARRRRPAPRGERGEDDFGTGRPRRRRWGWAVALGVLVVALAAGLFVSRDLLGLFFPPDYPGPGTGSVIVQVGEGDSTRAIGDDLAAKDVVESGRTFGSVAEDDPRGRGVAPGFYELRRQMSAQQALDALLDPASRLGRVDVRGGTQLDDTLGANNATVPGVLSLIARATCVPDPAGNPVCRTPDELRQVMATADPATLGVPAWAVDGVRAAAPNRRLEGLIAPGTYDVAPGSSAADALGAVVRESATQIDASGIGNGAPGSNLSPYQLLVVASVVEKEGVDGDFGKIARVIENRLPIPMRLQMDSTINYPLDKQTLLTTPADRAAPGPYNTYVNLGLPPTPIASPSGDALRAALSPDPGGWIYFVKCETDGTSCFAVTPEEHDANRRLAQERGVY